MSLSALSPFSLIMSNKAQNTPPHHHHLETRCWENDYYSCTFLWCTTKLCGIGDRNIRLLGICNYNFKWSETVLLIANNRFSLCLFFKIQLLTHLIIFQWCQQFGLVWLISRCRICALRRVSVQFFSDYSAAPHQMYCSFFIQSLLHILFIQTTAFYLYTGFILPDTVSTTAVVNAPGGHSFQTNLTIKVKVQQSASSHACKDFS